MATISVVFESPTAATVTGTVVVADNDIVRILAAEKIYLGTANDQETADRIAYDLTNELIGNTTTIERNQTPVDSIPVIEAPGKKTQDTDNAA